MSKKTIEKGPKLVPELLPVQPKKLFTYQNGDEYFGEFIVNLKLKFIKRHGNGSYTTITCQRFVGNWFEDRLVGFVKIIFPKNQSYDGELSEIPEYLVGQFNFGNGSRLVGDFMRNVDSNNSSRLEFYDPNNKIWNIKFSHEAKLIELTLPSNE